MSIILSALMFGAGAVAALIVCGIWYKHNKKRLAKVLTFFDVQARIDEILAQTDLDEKLVAKWKEIRDKVDQII
jgi:hypothetical protein